MRDLINISEEELREMSYDDPQILDDLVMQSGLELDILAEVFVKHPILQDSILRISDPVELYDAIYGNQVENTNPLDYEWDSKGREKAKAEYIRALNYIKQYVYEHGYEFEGTTIQQTIEDAPVEIEDWDDPYRTGWKEALKKRKEELSKLVAAILEDPDRMDEIFRSTDDLDALYDALESELLPDGIVFDDAEMYHNSVISEALEKLSRDYLYEEPEYGDLDLEVGTEFELLSEAEEELEEFYAEHPEFDNRPDTQIPEGMSIDEFSEAMGASINEFGEIIRPAGQDSTKSDIPPELLAWLNEDSTPLKKREEQLVALEKEAKTISEAEALISKQSQKTGEQK